MDNIIIKLIVEKPDFVVNLKVDRPSIKVSETITNMFKGEQGEQGLQGETGNGIERIVKTSTDALVDTYTIVFTNQETTTFTVTNGKIGADGKNAYQFAVDGGYKGSEEEFSKELSDIATKEFVKENGGKIDRIKVNGVVQTITNKEVNISVPTDNSELKNGANYINKEVSNLTNYTLSTETGSKLNLSINNSTFVVTMQLLNKAGNVIDTKTIDLPLETMVVNANYSNGIITLVLKNGTELPINVSTLVKGLVPDTRKINGKTLSSDIELSAEDVGVPEWARQPNAPAGSVVDEELSADSTNAVQNKVIVEALNMVKTDVGNAIAPLQLGLPLKAEKDGSNIEKENFRANLGIGSYVNSPLKLASSVSESAFTQIDLSDYLDNASGEKEFLLLCTFYAYSSSTYSRVRAYTDIQNIDDAQYENSFPLGYSKTTTNEYGGTFVVTLKKFLSYKTYNANRLDMNVSGYWRIK